MSSERVLVLGRPKSGTTAIAKTIHNTLGLERFGMEPNTLDELPQGVGGIVVKILFNSWSGRLDDLRALIDGRAGFDLTHIVCIVRDPRDEFISSLHYAAYDFFFYHDLPPSIREEWIDVFRQKERWPDAVSVDDMCRMLEERFGVSIPALQSGRESYEDFLQTIERPHFVLRYEDYIARTITPPELAAMLAGSRDVGSDLTRVRRSEGAGDWINFMLPDEIERFNLENAELLNRYGYPFSRPVEHRRIEPDKCSLYVARIIDEAISHREGAIRFGANLVIYSEKPNARVAYSARRT